MCYGREYAAQQRAMLKDKNLCDTCKVKQRKDGGIYCQQCLDNQRVQREHWKSDNKCIICGNLCFAGKARCSNCIDYAKKLDTKLRKERKQKKLCTKCGVNTAISPHAKCANCRTKKTIAQKILWDTRKSQGLCIICGFDALPSNCRCKKCYLKHISCKRTGKAANWILLEDLFESQNGICPYTGIKLTLGKNADLDHRVSVSDKGSNDISNLQWVLDVVNQMKWHHKEDDFLNAVRLIYEYKLKGR